MPTRNLETSLARDLARDSGHESAQQWAHDLRQPLSAILSNAQAALRLLARAECAGEVREILEDIVACDKRAALILRRLEEAQRSALAGDARDAEVLATGLLHEVQGEQG